MPKFNEYLNLMKLSEEAEKLRIDEMSIPQFIENEFKNILEKPDEEIKKYQLTDKEKKKINNTLARLIWFAEDDIINFKKALEINLRISKSVKKNFEKNKLKNKIKLFVNSVNKQIDIRNIK